MTPGATAYLLTDRFPRLILIANAVGALSSLIGAYISFYLDGATEPLSKGGFHVAASRGPRFVQSTS